MAETQDAAVRQLPPDFPVEPILGSIGGSQPKLLLCRGTNGTYVGPQRPPAEIMHRFTEAEYIANQVVTYFQRKKREYPEWTAEKNHERIRLALINKAAEGKWPFTPAEQAWIMCRLRARSAS